jgi:hypothetical protein
LKPVILGWKVVLLVDQVDGWGEVVVEEEEEEGLRVVAGRVVWDHNREVTAWLV